MVRKRSNYFHKIAPDRCTRTPFFFGERDNIRDDPLGAFVGMDILDKRTIDFQHIEIEVRHGPN